MSGNVETVQTIYAAFGAGRIPDILDRLSDDIIWIQPGGPEIPRSGTSNSKAEVAGFFGRLDAAAAIEQFETRSFFSAGDDVVVLGYWSGRAKRTGKPFASDWAMTWTLRDGKVARYQAFLDTSMLAKQF